MKGLKAGLKNFVANNLSWSQEVLLRNQFRLLSNYSYLRNYLRYGFIGDTVNLEASTMCQLKCPICPTATGENRTRPLGWGFLTFKDFKNFLDSYPGIRHIELSNWGEVFLNPEINDILEHAYSKGVSLATANGTNLNSVKEEVLEGVVKYQLKYMTISLDGASNETYVQYRKGGDFNRVISNIEKINRYKEQYGTEYPVMGWQFIVFGHNEHEIVRAREMAQSLNMTFQPRLNAYNVFSPVKDEETVKKDSGLLAASRKEFKEQNKRYWGLPCYQLWSSPQINWDGKLMGCCINGWGDFGNVFESGLKAALSSEKYTYAKKMLLGKVEERADIPCTTCPYYKDQEDLIFDAENGVTAEDHDSTS